MLISTSFDTIFEHQKGSPVKKNNFLFCLYVNCAIVWLQIAAQNYFNDFLKCHDVNNNTQLTTCN
jgi:hypothetical protein